MADGVPNVNDDPILQDQLLVVVGTGEKVWELADRRLAEKGRLLVLLTDSKPVGQYSDNGAYTWWPPERRKPVGDQARQMVSKYKSTVTRRWVCKGPDIVELKDDEVYEIAEAGRGVRVRSQGKMVWEVSAKTLVVDEVDDASTVDVRVTTGYFSTTPIPQPMMFLSACAVSVILFTVGLCFNDYEKEDRLPYQRIGYQAAIGGAWGACCATQLWGAGACGIADWRAKSAILHGFIAALTYAFLSIIPVGGWNTFTGMGVTIICVNTVCVNVLFPMHFYAVAQPDWKLGPGETEPERIHFMGHAIAWPRYWKWALAWVNTGFGGWISYYALGAVYVFLVGLGYGNTANIMLPLVASFFEATLVWVSQITFDRFQFALRASGDPWYCLLLGVGTQHIFAESVKLVAMVSGAAYCADHPDGLEWPNEGSCNPYGWVLSASVGLLITVGGRLGWSRFFVCRLFKVAGFKNAARRAAPTITTKLHDETKYLIGYIRFLLPISVLFANILTGKGAIIFNTPATICCICAFAAEIVEDLIMSAELIPYPPSPLPNHYMTMDNYNPRQLYAFGSERERALSSGRRSFKALSVLRSQGDIFPRAIPLHGTRGLPFMPLLGLASLFNAYSMFLFQLLLGAGYFHGVCPKPMPEADRFKEVALWPIPLSSGCRYSN